MCFTILGGTARAHRTICPKWAESPGTDIEDFLSTSGAQCEPRLWQQAWGFLLTSPSPTGVPLGTPHCNLTQPLTLTTSSSTQCVDQGTYSNLTQPLTLTTSSSKVMIPRASTSACKETIRVQVMGP